MSTVDKQLEDVKATIDEEVPRRISVSDVTYEGPELVIYTRDPKEFAANSDLVRRLASKLRKRITVRPDPDVLAPPAEAEEAIRELIPEEAGVMDLNFHADTGEVVVQAQKPGVVIGRRGSTLREITQEVGWTPEVVRTPPIESSTVENVRNFLKQEREDRRDILERVGRQIHREPMSDDEYVRITTLGCCREVGRAAFILSTPDTRILIDCGNKPGANGEQPYLDIPEAFGAGTNGIDAVVLTHAHLDHSALVPLLFEYGYDGPIYCTEPTRDLMGLLTLDHLDTAADDGRTPPYDSEMVREAIKHTIPLEYGDVTDIAPDIKLTLHNAGHILGSSVCHFHVGDGLYNVAFSGDIHYDDTRLFDGAVNDFPRVETLVLESTYGGRNDYQTDQEDSERKLKQIIQNAYDRNGKVLIPTFAVGRSQELMLVLEEAMRNGDIPEMPVHLDGMIWEATAVHTTYPEYLRDGLQDRIFDEDKNPFLADRFNPIDGDDEEREEIADGDSCIILSTSGMLTGGPVMSWLDQLGPDPDSTLTFVDYQAEGTLGKRIQRGIDEVPVSGSGRNEKVPLEMTVETVDGFSGHADRQGLENFVKTMNPRPEKILCVHGDESATQDLSSSLYHDQNIRTFAPENLETFRFR
ncbi:MULTISPECIES: beta-CASP ribonuclease aCPSF1 [Haloarcula]|uniref:Transcription termination factor FttA n=2 Tax=Haloarcula marismortui TaxID=2238 RepID=M0JTT0_9EURY|nr:MULTISPECIES: beta-CASP ribonuclease aCPSF1 [Haloarcula]EMA12542.1 mRNA 3'-end processing factor-like protein [Haloarcula sinaiiensis ATCC 33800]EMA21906.1 mRNA 3'-end processing factor-like protein [Haloarcula californiae ATCC 33799]NHN62205.1 beta-CASP ribonuclease aCPSF1 [Haloarcula sp. JP-Z28]QUJ70865.1 beta-CASP ribonuclease aCPSF1 [Haloarcula sinaiiensis ATCC 33800]